MVEDESNDCCMCLLVLIIIIIAIRYIDIIIKIIKWGFILGGLLLTGWIIYEVGGYIYRTLKERNHIVLTDLIDSDIGDSRGTIYLDIHEYTTQQIMVDHPDVEPWYVLWEEMGGKVVKLIKEIDKNCPVCLHPIKDPDPYERNSLIWVCNKCNVPHHFTCRKRYGRCASVYC